MLRTLSELIANSPPPRVVRVPVRREGDPPRTTKPVKVRGLRPERKVRAKQALSQIKLSIIEQARSRGTFEYGDIAAVLDVHPHMVRRHLDDIMKDPERHGILIEVDQVTWIYTVK